MNEKTGAERLEQVRGCLEEKWYPEALAALDGCVLLTASEAEQVYAAIGDCTNTGGSVRNRARRLLTLDSEQGDVGPPAPGEGDGYANPEMTVEC